MNIGYNVYAKSALKHDQIRVKEEIGCDGLEIQLLGELLGPHSDHDWLTVEEAFPNLEEFLGHNVHVVHAPLIPGHGDTLIERLADDLDVSLLQSIFKIAEAFGKAQDRSIIVVCHSELYVEFLEDLGGTWSRIVGIVDKLLEEYPHTELAIENVSPLRGVPKGNLHLANNCYLDNVEMAIRLRKELSTTRVGTVVDTCHQMLTEKYIGAIYDMMPDWPSKYLSLQAYLNANAEVLKLMHVCGMEGSGYGVGRHGTPFTEESKDVLQNICYLHDLIVPDVPITLEVEETDFATCNGYRSTKSVLEQLYKESPTYAQQTSFLL